MRGLFTCGVIDVFLREGIRFDAAAGISAGAAFGCNFKSRQPGRALRYNLKYCRDWRYCSLKSLIRTGDLYGADFCYRALPRELDPFDYAAFAADPMAFYVGATDVNTGRAVYHRCDDCGERDIAWIRASASMPLVSRPVEVDGLTLLDGGVADAIPCEFMRGKGYSRQVVVLTQPAGYVKRKSRMISACRLFLRAYPNLVRAMETRHEMYNRELEEIARREREGDALVIRPPESIRAGHVEREPERLKAAYALGEREALRRMDEVRAFLRLK